MKKSFVFPEVEVVALPESEIVTASIILPFFPFFDEDEYNLNDIMR